MSANGHQVGTLASSDFEKRAGIEACHRYCYETEAWRLGSTAEGHHDKEGINYLESSKGNSESKVLGGESGRWRLHLSSADGSASLGGGSARCRTAEFAKPGGEEEVRTRMRAEHRGLRTRSQKVGLDWTSRLSTWEEREGATPRVVMIGSLLTDPLPDSPPP
eukprot:2347422-Rhodomonas_salina.2